MQDSQPSNHNRAPATAPRTAGRFAPSPTGPLHFGSLVAAVASFLDARARGGRWLVRFEDIDRERCKTGFVPVILDTLQAFGLDWDGEVVFQSQRIDHYYAATERLAADGRLFACACSRREIADSGLSGIEGPVYPGTCRDKGLPFDGLTLRFRTDANPVSFNDRVQGTVTQQLERDIGDFVLRRRDGQFTYQLAVVVDDAEQGITDVVRGADLIDSTPRQITLQQALGLPTPAYLHHPVAVNAEGQKLSKQTLAPAIGASDAVRTLNRVLAFLGQHTHEVARPGELLQCAIAAWDVRAIPRQRAAPAPDLPGS